MTDAIKRRRRPRRAGPFSRELSTIDRRTKAGRTLKAVQGALVEHLGGQPSAPEMLIIQSAALKACRLSLLTEDLLAGAQINVDHANILAWANSMRLDLVALGLERRVKDVTPTLADLIKKTEPAR